MYRLLQRLTLIILAAMGLTLSHPANASHLAGADIQWECVGQDSFEVTLSVYRDCNGIALSKPQLNYSCQPNNITELDYVDGEDISRTCCSECQSSGCNKGYGFERHAVKWLVDFSGTQCSQVTLDYQEQARSNSITTGPSGTFYVEAWMDLNKAPCNNSPDFTKKPRFLFCKDQEAYHSVGSPSSDKDSAGNLLDSTTFEFTQPLKGPGQPVSWQGNYGYDDPLTWNGKKIGFPKDHSMPFGLHLDNTGELRFTPIDNSEITVIAIQANEYQNNQLVAQTTREWLVIVEDCTGNKAPDVSGFDCQPDMAKKSICVGEKVDFNFCSSDPNNPNKGDTVTLDFKPRDLPSGHTWTDNDGQVLESTGTFSWTPEPGDARAEPYVFAIQAKDDKCPIKGRNTRTFQIKVNPKPQANYSVSSQQCGQYQFSANATQGNQVTYQWSGKGGLSSDTNDLTHLYGEPGNYPFTLNLSANGCSNQYQDTVSTGQYVNLDLGNDTLLCEGNGINLDGTAKDNSGAVTYEWHDEVKGQPNRSFTNLKDDTTLYLTATDDVCSFTDTVKASVRKLPEVELGDDRGVCAGETLTLAPKVREGIGGTVDPPWLYLANGNQAPEYVWRNEASGQPLSQDSIYTFFDSGTYVLEIADTFGCQNTDTIEIAGNIDLNATAVSKALCKGSSTKLQASGGTAYEWISDGSLSCSSCAEPNASPDSTTTYFLTEAGSKGCDDTAQVKVEVNSRPNAGISAAENEICQGDSVTLTATGGTQYSWLSASDLSCSECQSPLAIPDSSKNFSAVVSNNFGCQDTAKVNIKVQELPEITASNDTTICKGTSVKLNASGATIYEWRPDSGLSCTNCSDPTVTPDNTTTYIVEGTDANGCKNSEMVTINVDNCTGFDEQKEIRDVKIYPNPNNGDFTAQITASGEASVVMELHSMTGKLIRQNEYRNNSNTLIQSYSLGPRQGVYFLKIRTGETVQYQRIVVQ